MAVIVDKARRDDEAPGIDRAARRSRQFADLDDPASLDRDIGAIGGAARAVDNTPVLDQQVIAHQILPFSRHPAKAGPIAAIPAKAGTHFSSTHALAGVDPDLRRGDEP
jgi:hypothetical protein